MRVADEKDKHLFLVQFVAQTYLFGSERVSSSAAHNNLIMGKHIAYSEFPDYIYLEVLYLAYVP